MKKRFQLDKENAMMMGVCAGIARHFGIDPTFVRIGAVLVTLLGAFPWTLLAYGIAAWVAKPRRLASHSSRSVGSLRSSTYDYRENSSDIDRRLAEVDTYVATSNSSLAREIEKLR